MKKDSTGVVVARVFITIMLTISIGLMSIGIALKATIFNLKTWKDFLMSDKFVDAIMEDADIDELMEDPILKDGLDEDFFPEYYNFMMDELFEALETGDTDIDEDRLDDLYDEYLEDLVYENATPSERGRFKDDFYDSACDGIEEALDEFEDSGLLDYMTKFDNGFKILLAITGIFSAILIVIMAVISKIKFAAARNTGIALVISEALNILAVGGLGALLTAAFKADGSDVINELAADLMSRCTLTAVGILVAGLALGIFLIIFGAISIKREIQVDDDVDAPVLEEE